MAISTSRTEAAGGARDGVPLIHSLFEAQVDRTPDATAVTQGRRRLTFRELDGRANEVAHLLRSRGIGPEHRVAVCLDRSPEMAIAVLGTLKAGAAYVPIDPGYPEERVALMLDDADCALVLTEQRLSHTFKSRSIGHVIVDVDDATTGTSERVPMLSDPDDLAYMIYTSGSTGRPKAVAVPHRGVVNHNLAIAEYFRLSALDRVAHCTSLSFDISVEELFPVLVARGDRRHVPAWSGRRRRGVLPVGGRRASLGARSADGLLARVGVTPVAVRLPESLSPCGSSSLAASRHRRRRWLRGGPDRDPGSRSSTATGRPRRRSRRSSIRSMGHLPRSRRTPRCQLAFR